MKGIEGSLLGFKGTDVVATAQWPWVAGATVIGCLRRYDWESTLIYQNDVCRKNKASGLAKNGESTERWNVVKIFLHNNVGWENHRIQSPQITVEGSVKKVVPLICKAKRCWFWEISLVRKSPA